jgi:hypothetical protein
MAEYQHLTADEILHLAEERDHLTEEARLALDWELQRGKLSPSDVDSYRIEHAASERAENLRVASRLSGISYISHVGVGRKFLGKSNRRRDPSGLFEQYETTLWFVVLWFPVFPIATCTVRSKLERWLGLSIASSEVAIERHPRNWEQILLTWVKATLVVLALRLGFLLLLRHPAWLRHIG